MQDQVEIWFSKIERDHIHRGIFTSVPDLAKKIKTYIVKYNAAPTTLIVDNVLDRFYLSINPTLVKSLHAEDGRPSKKTEGFPQLELLLKVLTLQVDSCA